MMFISESSMHLRAKFAVPLLTELFDLVVGLTDSPPGNSISFPKGLDVIALFCNELFRSLGFPLRCGLCISQLSSRFSDHITQAIVARCVGPIPDLNATELRIEILFQICFA